MLFTECISEINNTQVDNEKDQEVAIPMHYLIEYSNIYVETSGSLWQYDKNDPNDSITYSESFKFKSSFTNDSGNVSTANVEIAVQLKYLSNFWRNLELQLKIVKLMLTWSANKSFSQWIKKQILQ